jgi:large subunit ribosomal protein L20
MSRVKGGVTSRARHKKVLKMSKGFLGRSKNCYRPALERLEKSLQYAYRDRRNRKRDLRNLWIVRINAAVREHGMKYSEFIHAMNSANVLINRKMLAEMAVNDKEAFAAIVEKVKSVK